MLYLYLLQAKQTWFVCILIFVCFIRRIILMNGQMGHIVFNNLSSRSRFILFGLLTLIPDSSRPGVGSSYYFDRTSVIILWFLYWSEKNYIYTLWYKKEDLREPFGSIDPLNALYRYEQRPCRSLVHHLKIDRNAPWVYRQIRCAPFSVRLILGKINVR